MDNGPVSSKRGTTLGGSVQDLPIRYWFIAALVTGSVFIFVGEQLFESLILTVAVPLAVMALYMAIGRSYVQHGLSRTQYADSIYYLGFLFTLASITAAIVDYDSGDQMRVISRFGVKLITTLVGLGARVYLVNFRPSMDDVAENVEESLTRAAQQMRERLDRITLDLDALTTALSLTLKSASERVSSELATTITAANTAFSESLSVMKGEILVTLTDLRSSTKGQVEETADQLARVLRELGGSVGEASSSLAGGLSGLGEQIGRTSRDVGEASIGLAESLRATQLPEDLFAARLSPAVASLARALEAPAERILQLERTVAEIGDRLGSLMGSFERLSATGAQAESQLERFAERLDGANVGHLSTAAAAAGSKIDQLSIAVEDGARRLRSANEASDEIARQVNAHLAQIRERAVRLDEETQNLIAELRESLAAAQRRAQRGLIGRVFSR